MRVVVLSLTDPWRASHGGTIRTRALVAALTDLGHSVVAVFPESGEGGGGTPAQPVPEGVEVVAVPASTVGNRAWPGWVRSLKRTLLPLPTAAGARSGAVQAALSRIHAEAPVDLLLVSVLPFTQYLDQLPGARLWVDHSDLFSDVLAREAARRHGVARLTAGLQLRAVRRQEQELAATAAVTTTAGHDDARSLAGRSAGGRVTWLPTPVSFRDVDREPSARPVAGLFANFRYWPNRDAWDLLRTVWAPRLAAHGWDVVVAGLASEELEPAPHVRIVGAVVDPADFYAQVDVTLAPIRVGGGMKVKVVESLSHGRPVVATAFAVAGFPESLEGCVDVVDADQPDLAFLADGVPAVPAAAADRLEPFTAQAFRRTVGTLVGGSVGSVGSVDGPVEGSDLGYRTAGGR